MNLILIFDYYIFSDIDVDFGIRLCPDLFNCHTDNILNKTHCLFAREVGLNNKIEHNFFVLKNSPQVVESVELMLIKIPIIESYNIHDEKPYFRVAFNLDKFRIHLNFMLGQIGITIFDDENKFVVDDILDNILHPQYLSIIETIDTETYNSYTKYVEQLSSCDDDRYNEKLKLLRGLIRETTDFNLRVFYVYILARCLQKCGDYEKIFKYVASKMYCN